MSVSGLTDAAPRLVATRATDGDETYFAARRGGITATEVRDWVVPSKRRAILTQKVTGEYDTGRNRYFAHGAFREPFIAEWAAATHGVVPSSVLYAHPDNPRHLCTPDGYLAGFTLGYEPGADAVTVEVKTSTKNLLPGRLDDDRVLVEVDESSHFARMLYMRQVQWQMYVMNAAKCLFIWEPFTAKVDPESGYFTVTGPPEWCFIPRDQGMIDALVVEADAALALIDSSRASGMPPVSDVPVDEAILLEDLFAAREAVAVAEAQRDRAWAALSALYEPRGVFSESRGFATVTRSEGKPGTRTVVDEDAMRRRAPALVARYEALRARFTTVVDTVGRPRLTITDNR